MQCPVITNWALINEMQERRKMSFKEPTGWIQTFTGKKFIISNPKPEDICIEDIAHSLSMICRFTGHPKEFYSVAQHSILVSEQCSDKNKLWGLLHDSTEAYMADLNRPLKRMKELAGYRVVEKKLQGIICAKFGLPEEEPDEVKIADTRMLATEARDLMSPLHPDWQQPEQPYLFRIEGKYPDITKALFLKRFEELTRKKI